MTESMREAIIHDGPRVEIITSPIPTPGPGQLLIQTHYTASNQKDWIRPTILRLGSMNQGDNVAGIVQSPGFTYRGFSVGDRVAALHCPGEGSGTYADYCIVESWAAWYIPDTMSMAEAVTIPLASMMAAAALWRGLQAPWPEMPGRREPIVITGANSSLGAFGVKLAKLSGLGPVIAVAADGREFVESLLEPEKGDRFIEGEGFIDWRSGEGLSEVIEDALNGYRVRLVYEAFGRSYDEEIVTRVRDEAGRAERWVTVLPLNPTRVQNIVEEKVTISSLMFKELQPNGVSAIGHVWAGEKVIELIESAVAQGVLRGHPYELIEGGLDGIESGLRRLQEGSSTVMFVYELVSQNGG